jgi:O-antigen/teichoic acid export membrane protein
VRSSDEILPFVRRTLRLALPIAVACLFTLFFAEPIIRLLYGSEKTDAVLVFILLSIPSLVSLTFVAVAVLFHYFFKPHYLTLERVVQSVLFILGSLYFVRYGAVGVAAVSMAANLIGFGVSFRLLALEFQRRGLDLGPRMWRTFGYSSRD